MAIITNIFLFIWMSGVCYAALHILPRAEGLGETGRILHFHVPMAWTAVLSFIISLVNSVLVLKNSRMENDIAAEVASRLGLLFCVLATVTGAVFAKFAWGAYWNWDPRETSIVVLMLIYMAYFGLRSAITDPDKRMRASAVYAILACCVMPLLVFVIPRIYMSLHPDLFQQGKMAVDQNMRYVLFASLAGFTGIYYWIYNLSFRIEKLNRKMEGYDV